MTLVPHTSSTNPWSSLYLTEEKQPGYIIVYSSTSVGFSQSTICLTSWVSIPLVIAFHGFCPSYSLQANNPDPRNREGSVLFTILITLSLALVTFQPLHYSDYIKSCCSLLFTAVHYSDYIKSCSSDV